MLSLWLDKESKHILTHYYSETPGTEFNRISSSYNYQGELTSIYLNTSSSMQASQKPEDKSLKNCLDELVQIAKTKDLAAFAGHIGESVWKNLGRDPTIDDLMFLHSFGLFPVSIPTDLQDRKKEEILDRTFHVVNTDIANEMENDVFIKANAEFIVTALSIPTAYSIIKAIEANPEIITDDLVKQHLKETILKLSNYYYDQLSRAGEIHVTIELDSNDENKQNKISISNRDDRLIDKETIELDENYVFDEYTYSIIYDIQNKKYIVTVSNNRKQNDTRKFEFSEKIDPEQLFELASNPQNKEWESVLENQLIAQII